MDAFSSYGVWQILLALIAGAGIALNFTLLEGSETWLQVVVATAALTAPFIAGWISQRLTSALLLPLAVVVCLSVGFGVFGAGSRDVDPVMFALVLSIIYGSLASAIFAAGWMARWLLQRIRRQGFIEGSSR